MARHLHLISAAGLALTAIYLLHAGAVVTAGFLVLGSVVALTHWRAAGAGLLD